jgi:hypothetical protein
VARDQRGGCSAQLRFKPALGRQRIAHGLGGGEGLGGHQKKCLAGIQPRQQPGQLVAVHVRHKMQALSRHGKFSQRLHRHLRP